MAPILQTAPRAATPAHQPARKSPVGVEWLTGQRIPRTHSVESNTRAPLPGPVSCQAKPPRGEGEVYVRRQGMIIAAILPGVEETKTGSRPPREEISTCPSPPSKAQSVTASEKYPALIRYSSLSVPRSME